MSSPLPTLSRAPLPDQPLPDLPPAPTPGTSLAALLPNMRKLAKGGKVGLHLPKRPPVSRAVQRAPVVERERRAEAARTAAAPAREAQRAQTQAANATQRAQATAALRDATERRRAHRSTQPAAAPTPIRPGVEVGEPTAAPPQRGGLGATAQALPNVKYPGGAPTLYRDMTPDEQAQFLRDNPGFVQSQADKARGGSYLGARRGKGPALRPMPDEPERRAPTSRTRRAPKATEVGTPAPEPPPTRPPAVATPAEAIETARGRPTGELASTTWLRQFGAWLRAREGMQQRRADRKSIDELRRELEAMRGGVIGEVAPLVGEVEAGAGADVAPPATAEEIERLRKRLRQIDEAKE